MRYITNAAVTLNITFQNLLDAYLVASTAVQGHQVFQTVKIRRVRCWAAAALGAATAVEVEFSGLTAGITGDQVIHTDTSMGIQPAYVSARPSRRCLASEFQLSSAATAVTIRGPSGMVIDMELTYHGQFVSTTNVANALVGATPGGFYLRGLDGLATAGTQVPPEFAAAQI
jgi:hypothetical protein